MASLVAYDNSDESESDEETQILHNPDVDISQNQSDILPSTEEDKSISDEEPFSEEVPNSSLFKFLPAPKKRINDSFVEEVEDEFLGIRTISSKHDLNSENTGKYNQTNKLHERSTLLLPSIKQKNLAEDNADPDENRTLIGQTKLGLKETKKAEKKVKITVPPLSVYDSDDDDDEEERNKKRIKLNKGKSGLFAILPSPKNLSAKTTKRTLIPNSVSKQQKANNSLSNRNLSEGEAAFPVHSLFPSNTEAANDSDDDTEAVSFFSLNENEKKLPLDYQDASLGKTEYSWESGKTSDSVIDEDMTESSDIDLKLNENTLTQEVSEMYPRNAPSEERPLEIDDEILLRLQGKRRHKQEEINIIDVSQGDQLSQNAEWLMKDLTEEKVSRAHRLKTHLPTAQQRRKHQITYLAFQAKERELELKNQWAQNRLTKRQTQSKYGF